MLPPVLEVLFKNCDFETLKLARQVCKTWLAMSIDAFSKSSLINFYSMNPATYLGTMKSIEDGRYVPVNVALTLSPLAINSEYQYSDSNAMRVCPWLACEDCIFPFGESIQCLKFYAWDSVTETLNTTIFREILLAPVYLKTLEISLLPEVVSSKPLFQLPWKDQPPLFYLTSLIMYGKLECSEDFLDNFLSAMPNVESIMINCCSRGFLDLFSTALYRLPLRKVNDLKLNFAGGFSQSHISNLERANLKLRTLHMAPRSLVIKYDDYTKLLTRLAPTLEEAKLTTCSRLPMMEQYVVLPFMPQLKELQLQTWRGGMYGFWNLDFISQAPNLETLIIERRGLFATNLSPIEQAHDLLWNIEQDDVKPHKNLVNLVLPLAPLQFPTPKSLASLLLKCYHLKTLALSANDACLKSVFKHAVRLEELVITEYSEVTDKGITGLGNDDFPPKGVIRVSYNTNVGITRLKGLKRLEIDGFAGEVTDFAVEYGIQHLKRLKSVTLRSCKITERGIKMLSKFQLTLVQHDHWQRYEQVDESI